MVSLSTKSAKIRQSPTLFLTEKANALKEQGKDIISLTVGEPDFDTPSNIKFAAISAINKGYTKYTKVDGIHQLKDAIIAKFMKDNKLAYDRNEVIVSSGCKQVLYNLFMATLNDGDEVIIPAPYWVSYPDMVLIAGGTPVVVECNIDTGYKLTPHSLARSITPKTKWLIINSPSNPSGACYTKAELSAIAEVLNQNSHVNILSDDIYEKIMFDETIFYNIATAVPQLKERVFIANGVSKSYSMTGWRIGYGAGDASIIKAMNIIQSQSTSNPCSISQYAALEALTGDQSYINNSSAAFSKRLDLALKTLSSVVDMEIYRPDGAFYIFPSIAKLMGRTTKTGKIINNCTDFADALLDEVGVAVVPGSAFGLKNHFRISTAISNNELREACSRIKDFCLSLTYNR
ncbi:MAG: pyridoxal phosphate-dependent aminotransferase [Rickettsiaceae bacterium]|nr:pyridoxal phosphate-dependent aminotransferase [Rickettsiaceae bacterium]